MAKPVSSQRSAAFRSLQPASLLQHLSKGQTLNTATETISHTLCVVRAHRMPTPPVLLPHVCDRKENGHELFLHVLVSGRTIFFESNRSPQKTDKKMTIIS